MALRKAISDVFTPRNSEINEAMYVQRPALERELSRSLTKNTHTLIFGESGNGKSWLYKKVLSQLGIPYIVANCANAARKDSLTEEICDSIYEYCTGGAAGSRDLVESEVLLSAFREFRKNSDLKKIIVLDNLESIFSKPALMEELANVVILLDDVKYAQNNVNFLIVGVPNGVLDYYTKTDHLDSVANRIEELTKISGLTAGQVAEFISRGFAQLGVSLEESQRNRISAHTYRVTLGIPQRVHEYCEALAYKIEDNSWLYHEDLLPGADQDWLMKGLRKSYSVIQFHLNSRDTTVARRNQVLYVVGKLTRAQFDSGVIDDLIRREFPDTVPQTNMGIGTILGELSTGDNPVLCRTEKGKDYYVKDPRYIMCIRMMLYKDPAINKVGKRNFIY
ncbi:ATP-binding protein [Pseudoduganella sp. SL102]|uniref:ATP-binding protein n=1 Tax=Pseudoduganella sp. SL102 TaxID=2995154 RepID=UPI00248B6B55|nr:ATP-binding protein [Pseudoduganella sp. SL102]WBS00698.1 ATP-binding protein [Pseudoduganella sp. SL102]